MGMSDDDVRLRRRATLSGQRLRERALALQDNGTAMRRYIARALFGDDVARRDKLERNLRHLAYCLEHELYHDEVSCGSIPKGMWVTSSGRKVVFSAGYRPLLQVQLDGGVELADDCEWVTDISKTVFFYELPSFTPRLQQPASCRQFRAILNRWLRGV
jgi:hypothetical protein